MVVSRQKGRFQHRARQINKMRTKDEMTVADMHRLVYEEKKDKTRPTRLTLAKDNIHKFCTDRLQIH